MQVGLGTGASGADVEQLQSILATQGHPIDPGERGEFGPSTLAALQAFQAKHKIAETGAVDAPTLAALLQVEQNAAASATRRPRPRRSRSTLAPASLPASWSIRMVARLPARRSH